MRLPFAAVACLCLALFASITLAQPKKAKPAAAEDADAEAAQQRTVAISLVSSLADEARSFKDQTRRARVQARAADVLWDTDPERARELFRRAWEAAETVDAENAKKRAEEMKRLEASGEPVVIRGGPDLRSEVLRLVAKRDRKLGEEFLKALDEAAEKERSEAATEQRFCDVLLSDIADCVVVHQDGTRDQNGAVVSRRDWPWADSKDFDIEFPIYRGWLITLPVRCQVDVDVRTAFSMSEK